MSRLEELIQELCPDGVSFRKIGSCIKKVTNIKWSEHSDEEYQYIDLTSVDRETHSIMGTQTITSEDAPSRAQQIVRENDVLLGTTRPMLKRYCMIPDKYDGEICSTGFCVLRADEGVVLPRYLFHVVSSTEFFIHVDTFQKGASYPAISDADTKKYSFPVPPMEVQHEIVRILDNFTELTAELTEKLTAELTARKKQYGYYRDRLLTFQQDAGISTKKIGEISNYRRGSFPQPYGKSDWYDGDGSMPFVQVADIGENMRLIDDTKRKISKIAQEKSVFAPKGSIIISLQGSIGRIAITQYDAYIDRTVAIFYDISDELLPRYFAYQLQRVFSERKSTARGSTIKTITKDEFTEFPIAIPALKVQERIISVLDNFDAICSDLNIGLPAEIEARQKQYEYYRDALLTFAETGTILATDRQTDRT